MLEEENQINCLKVIIATFEERSKSSDVDIHDKISYNNFKRKLAFLEERLSIYKESKNIGNLNQSNIGVYHTDDVHMIAKSKKYFPY